jgi:serine/threonine-protein kinase
MTDPLLGRVLNERFRILEPLGAGGMGKVYKAMQAPLDRLVALKVLNPQYGGDGKDPGFQKRFFLEASVTAKLRHPNTVTVIDYGKTDDGIYYIAMEYLEGLTLGQLLTQVGPLPWARALNITQQIARSLREAHRVGLIHRDLKPANVMVLNQETDHDVVKVLDFGLVKSFIGDSGPLPQDTSLTQAGIILGSPQYMAPEQARNIADPRSDVYSMGVVLYQMLMGRPPFLAQQSIDVIVKHINEAPPSFGAMWPEHTVPAEVEALVMKCLAKIPAERYQSMDEVLEAMRRTASTIGVSGVFSGPRITGHGSGPISGAYATGSGPSTMSLDISVDEAPAKSRRPLAIALFGGSLLLGISAAVVLALRSPAPTPPPDPAPARAAAQTAAAGAQKAPEAATDDELGLVPLTPVKGATVKLHIDSEPNGATVSHEGKAKGKTPLSLDFPVDANGFAEGQLVLTLDGYKRAVEPFKSRGPTKTLFVSMERAEPKKKTAPKPDKGPDSSYKDSPY